jgi:hypothetical protein
MKKIYTLVAAFAVVLSANAQNKAVGTSAATVHKTNKQIRVMPMPAERAGGDTLMWLPAPGVFLSNAADQTAFDLVTEDIDGLPTNNAGFGDDWGLVFSDNIDVNGSSQPTADNWYFPWENPILAGGTDSAFFWRATSWFNPAGTANNWMMMGPITIPANGATLSWFDRTNPAYRDGYKVFVQSTSTVSTPVTFADFTGTAIYTKTDAYPSPTYTTDTTWVLRTAAIPASVNGQQIHIAFQHNANDMDVLYLDNILVVEAIVGVNEFVNGAKFSQNAPNPFGTVTSINYELQNSAKVTLNVYDVTGKKVIEQNQGDLAAGKHSVKVNAENLAAGVYYYSLKVNENVTSSMKMVVVK